MSPLEILFMDGLAKMYYAEQRILTALPKMRAAAQSAELVAGFEKHEVETEDQIDRLQQVFESMGRAPQAKECAAIDGLLLEGEKKMSSLQGTSALDAALVLAGHAVEHYEIAHYGALASWANSLGMDAAADLLDVSLDEEVATDVALTELADGGINEAALNAA